MTIVPPDQLHPETLKYLIEEFVTRDGAIQGHAETPMEIRVQSVLRQLKACLIVIVFDEEDESCTLIAKEQLMPGS